MKNPIKVVKAKVDDTFNEKKIEQDVNKGVMENGSIVWFVRQLGSSIRHLFSLLIDSIGSMNEKNRKNRKRE